MITNSAAIFLTLTLPRLTLFPGQERRFPAGPSPAHARA